MKRIVVLILVMTLTTNIFACWKKAKKNSMVNKRSNVELTDIQEEISDNANLFTFKLLKEISSLENNKTTNIFLSPFSAATAFSMVSAGAVGETQKQILNTLCYGNYTQDQINEYYKMIVPTLLSADNSTVISVANSVWTLQGFNVKSSYISKLKSDYSAESRVMSQDGAKAVREINKWCSDNTNGLIKQMVDNVDNLQMMLINALYFKGIWKDKFEASKSYDDKFYNEDGSETEVKYMFRKTEGAFYEDEQASAITLPYGNGAYAMTIVLPAKGISIDELLASINMEQFNDWRNGLKRCNVEMSIPRFDVEYATGDKLETALKNMGMVLPFTNAADLSGISNSGLCVDRANQKAVIKVNEEGTEAAAVTTIGVRLTSVGPIYDTFIFKANRPFLYFISETSTGVVLFAGKQINFNK